MARLARVSPIGVTQHIVQRGNNRQACFVSEKDMKAYLNWLKEFSKKVFRRFSCLDVNWIKGLIGKKDSQLKIPITMPLNACRCHFYLPKL